MMDRVSLPAARPLWVCAVALALVSQTSCGQRNGEGAETPDQAADSVYGQLLMDYLRANFDDLHDVSMRFHHLDHTIGGMIVFATTWENGVLTSVTVATNETNNADLSGALIEKFRTWSIEGLDGPFQTSLPINVQLVGSDEPEFSATALVTGTVTDVDGQPLHRAEVEFLSTSPGQAPVPAARTNREGVFVRTLIPPGEWRLRCSHDGWIPVVIEGIALTAGQHHRESFVLKPTDPGDA